MLANHLGNRLSRNAYRNLAEANVLIDRELTCDEPSLRLLLERAKLPVHASVVELESSIGGAVTAHGTYGVCHQLRHALAVTNDPPMRRARLDQVAPTLWSQPVFRIRGGNYPLCFVREDGRILEQHADRSPRVLYDSIIQHVEVVYLTPSWPDAHEVTIAAAVGEPLAQVLNAERFDPASGELITSWSGEQLGLVERRGLADGRLEPDELRTVVTARDRDSVVAALVWCADASLDVAWSGPWSRPRGDQSRTLGFTFSPGPYSADIEVGVWGDAGDRAIASRCVGDPWPWAR